MIEEHLQAVGHRHRHLAAVQQLPAQTHELLGPLGGGGGLRRGGAGHLGVCGGPQLFEAEAEGAGIQFGPNAFAALDALGIGDIARELNSTLRRYGYDRGDNRCGYPIGLSYPPDWGERTMSLRESDTTVLQPGMTFHFMPGLWLDDWGLETTESILITESGVETLCDFPRQLFVKA